MSYLSYKNSQPPSISTPPSIRALRVNISFLSIIWLSVFLFFLLKNLQHPNIAKFLKKKKPKLSVFWMLDVHQFTTSLQFLFPADLGGGGGQALKKPLLPRPPSSSYHLPIALGHS